MNQVKIGILIVAIIFLLLPLFIELPEMLNNILYGLMAFFSILFLLIKRKDLNIDSMFDKDKKDKK